MYYKFTKVRTHKFARKIPPDFGSLGRMATNNRMLTDVFA
jgi:hypothetical protein